MTEPPTACRHPVSGTLSLPSSGCFSPFPHGTCALSVTEEYLGLEGGPPIFRQDGSCPALLVDLCRGFPVRGSHPLWPAFPGASGSQDEDRWPHPLSLATTRGVSRTPGDRGRLRPLLMSFPPATEMFQFAGFASPSYEFRERYPRLAPRVGCPIRRPRDHRSLASPPGFSQRAASFLASRCQGIPRMPFFGAFLLAITLGPPPKRPQDTPRRTPSPGTPQAFPGGRTAAGARPAPKRGRLRRSLARRHPFPGEWLRIRETLPLRGAPAKGPPCPHLSSSPCKTAAPGTSFYEGSSRRRNLSPNPPSGGGERVRTDDLLLAKQALSQLSYTPARGPTKRTREPPPSCEWWAREDLNLRPHAYQARALTR
jgi:hypothetical protein